jgi:hypothetical protein
MYSTIVRTRGSLLEDIVMQDLLSLQQTPGLQDVEIPEAMLFVVGQSS